ncbi:LacI family DNA-binding transcriptional regulator [Novosphingobium sp.]|uniref:LacI family DNA-binding transcriptional regulator n=1 Tax=Novosphingobium sp. TaxID=1874826 RepID=UPI0025E5C138|nr:LacI family DNA-binding transcriptional regulator [Novosphingobium sp.]
MAMIGSAETGQPTINDVAAHAGVSKKTVSRVINGSPLLTDATRAKVKQSIEALGFVPNPQARALAFGRNFMIVLLHDNPNAQTVLNFQSGILQAIGNTDLALAVRPVDRSSPAMLDDIREFLEKQRPLGVLLLPPISENDDIARLCTAQGVRYVRVGSAVLDDADHCVASNDREMVAAACRSLIAAGHRSIGFVRGPAGFRSALERETGFRDAIAEAGIRHDPALVFQGNYRFRSGQDAGRALLAVTPPPTAILASNDEMAAGLLYVALERGIKVPQELSIIGFDDSPTASHIWPALSTVRWPILEMGELAARKLVRDFLPGEDKADLPVTLNSTFIERDSVAPPQPSRT